MIAEMLAELPRPRGRRARAHRRRQRRRRPRQHLRRHRRHRGHGHAARLARRRERSPKRPRLARRHRLAAALRACRGRRRLRRLPLRALPRVLRGPRTTPSSSYQACPGRSAASSCTWPLGDTGIRFDALPDRPSGAPEGRRRVPARRPEQDADAVQLEADVGHAVCAAVRRLDVLADKLDDGAVDALPPNHRAAPPARGHTAGAARLRARRRAAPPVRSTPRASSCPARCCSRSSSRTSRCAASHPNADPGLLPVTFVLAGVGLGDRHAARARRSPRPR